MYRVCWARSSQSVQIDKKTTRHSPGGAEVEPLPMGVCTHSMSIRCLAIFITCTCAKIPCLLRRVTISYHSSHLPSNIYLNNKHVYSPFTAESVIIRCVYTMLLPRFEISLSVTSVHTVCVQRGLQGALTLLGAILRLLHSFETGFSHRLTPCKIVRHFFGRSYIRLALDYSGRK